MGNWRYGASAKEFERLHDYLRVFDFVEVDLERCVDLGFSFYEIGNGMRQCGDILYSVHLRYKNTNQLGLVDCADNDLSYLQRRGLIGAVSMFVSHTNYPQDEAELREQIRGLGGVATKYNVTIAVEHLVDRKDHLNGYNAPRNPLLLAELIEELGNPHLGLCLDNGHAISNSERTDSMNWDDLVKKHVRHVHYSYNVVGDDLHQPISLLSDQQRADMNSLLAGSVHDGVVMFENRTYEQSVESLQFLSQVN